MDFMDCDIYLSLIQKNSRSKNYVHFEFGYALLEFGCFADSMVGPDSAVLLLRFLLKIRSVKILDTILCSGALL